MDAAFSIVKFVLAERIEVTSDCQLLAVNEVPRSIQLLNPSPGTMETMLEFAVGIEARGLQANVSVSAIIEMCHEDVGKWIRIRQDGATVAPHEGDRWLMGTSINFPPAREGTYKFRLTLQSSGLSQRAVRKVTVRYRPTKVASA